MMKKTVAKPADDEQYNVVCLECETVFEPIPGSSLWWRAKQRAERGLLDALCISGEEHGCIEKPYMSNAMYRVFGFSDLCEDFSVPCNNFVGAVRLALGEARHGSTVFVDGVSEAVATRISLAW